MTQPSIALERVTKSYRSRSGVVHALKEISLDVAPGEFVSIVGPSGCGKSTILKIIAGIMGSAALTSSWWAASRATGASRSNRAGGAGRWGRSGGTVLN